MHVFVRQYTRLQFYREPDESYQEKRTRISGAVMRTNVVIERHARGATVPCSPMPQFLEFLVCDLWVNSAVVPPECKLVVF